MIQLELDHPFVGVPAEGLHAGLVCSVRETKDGPAPPTPHRPDRAKNTPYEYLIKMAPLQKVEHVVRAIMATSAISSILDMADNEACLLIERRTWTKERVASTAKLYHPGSRYELSGLFKPE